MHHIALDQQDEAVKRFVLSLPLDPQASKVLAQAKILGVPAVVLGKVGGAALQIKAGQGSLSCDLKELYDAWWNSIARAMA